MTKALKTFILECKSVKIYPDEDKIEIRVRGPKVAWVQAYCEDNDIICDLERVGLFYYATLRLSEVF